MKLKVRTWHLPSLYELMNAPISFNCNPWIVFYFIPIQFFSFHAISSFTNVSFRNIFVQFLNIYGLSISAHYSLLHCSIKSHYVYIYWGLLYGLVYKPLNVIHMLFVGLFLQKLVKAVQIHNFITCPINYWQWDILLSSSTF